MLNLSQAANFGFHIQGRTVEQTAVVFSSQLLQDLAHGLHSADAHVRVMAGYKREEEDVEDRPRVVLGHGYNEDSVTITDVMVSTVVNKYVQL